MKKIMSSKSNTPRYKLSLYNDYGFVESVAHSFKGKIVDYLKAYTRQRSKAFKTGFESAIGSELYDLNNVTISRLIEGVSYFNSKSSQTFVLEEKNTDGSVKRLVGEW